MQKFNYFLALIIALALSGNLQAQKFDAKFGKGIQITGKDSSFHMKAAFRFQNLFSNEWTISDGEFTDYNSNFLIRRSRFKFDGWAVTPKLKYKLEMGLSNRDVSGVSDQTRNSDRLILDAYLDWNFYKNFSIKVGQAKLASNRERVISSANLQFVDRSRLNSRYNIDRDMGLFFKHHFKLGENFIIQEVVSFTQGEGRNITEGHNGGFDMTYRVEFLPFGKFASKGDYVGSAIKREPKPKLSVGVSLDNNYNAIKTRGQNGSYIRNLEGDFVGKDLTTVFVDFMFKHKGFSMMGEYANKRTEDDNPDLVIDSLVYGTYYTGTGLNLQAGYMFDNNWEVAARYTQINPDTGVDTPEKQYTLGLSKFVVGHKLKVQTDVTLRDRAERDNNFIFRTQVDIHF